MIERSPSKGETADSGFARALLFGDRTNLQVLDRSATSLDVNWAGLAWAQGYQISRRLPGGKWRVVKSLKGSVRDRWTDNGLKPGAKYCYWVTGLDQWQRQVVRTVGGC